MSKHEQANKKHYTKQSFAHTFSLNFLSHYGSTIGRKNYEKIQNEEAQFTFTHNFLFKLCIRKSEKM
jgi:hypothetical protein